MSWRYRVGSALNAWKHGLLSNQRLPLNRFVPHGLSWMYDIQRMAGTRRLGVLLDVGANVGQTAWGLVRYFPHSRIYCFEPVSSVFEQLKSRYGGFSNVTCIQAALGAAPGTATIALESDSERNTLVPGGATWSTPSGRVETIRIDTIDRFCATEGITDIEVLKMDVQGWEMEVLKGCSIRPRYIYSEVGFSAGERDMQAFGPFDAHMQSMGYLFGGLYDVYRYGPGKGRVGFASALYSRVD